MDHPERGGVTVLESADPAAVPVPRAEPEPASRWARALAGVGYRAPQRAPLDEQLVPPMPDGPGVTPRSAAASPVLARLGLRLPDPLWSWLCRWSGWLGPLAVALFAGVLRFANLGNPHALIFDETYYAKDAYALWQLGYESNWSDDANGLITAPNPSVPLRTDAAYVVHPPVGKWIIGLGEQLFHMTPFGWRFMMAVLGTLSVLMMARIGRRLFRSTLLGCVAGLLLSVDGLHFVLSRTAILDLIVMFWFLAAFGLLLIDRDRSRARIAERIEQGLGGGWWVLGWRPYRLAAGVCLGLMMGTKWSGGPAILAFVLLTAVWDSSARRLAGRARGPVPAGGAGGPRSVLANLWDVFWSGLTIGLTALGTYLVTWSGWIFSSTEPGKGGYFRDWALHNPSDQGWIPDWVRSLWHYHHEVWEFHTHLHSPHTYQSNPWSWLVLGRPVSFFYESPKNGQAGCTTSECAREVLAIGTPFLWWAGIAAVLFCLYRWLMRRDWRAGAILCGVAAGYLPWFMYQERTIFLFYAVCFVPFLVLAVTMMIGAMLGPADASPDRRLAGATGAGLLVAAVMWNFLYFFPLYTGQTIPMEDWRARMWLSSWI
ncbi:dolichyl-phosphate-mannose--protein mannosyltransferase [Streptomyces sp. TLI_171]|uniref:dolichyl-phosphate-mannose--protein mannosyltransferase n=1 Tax=Streptomyces sp. TLI_171 TaxID=1938859 RepID=UPI000C17906F|nr:phospholipid carrier-dependent glycosyltransferase [Streptomyces sp. TLI_171]RKE20814.1 dolichyl-phosphate-mannose-protein mannosyltransferase [Streptomyces sp. TLI_171]